MPNSSPRRQLFPFVGDEGIGPQQGIIDDYQFRQGSPGRLQQPGANIGVGFMDDAALLFDRRWYQQITGLDAWAKGAGDPKAYQ